METRKFIWNLFLVIIFGVASLVLATRLDGFWSIAVWLLFCILTGFAVSQVESTFKTKPNGKQ